jgi:hypothetical protein
MFTVSRLAKTSSLVLLTATLTTAAYAHGGGHGSSNGSMGSRVPTHASSAQPSARIATGHGSKTLSKGPAYWCGPHHHNCVNPLPVVHIPTAPQGAAQ